MSRNEELKLHVLKVDEEAGVTVENNEFYQAVLEIVEADPKMGAANDFSLYPYSVLENKDGEPSLLCFIINRLEKPIKNLSFNFTFGNQDGEYIFDSNEVRLPNEYLGNLDKDALAPILLTMNKEDVDLFYTIDEHNVYVKMDDFGIDFIES